MRDDGYADFVNGRSAALIRSTTLLTGDRHDAEDLVQEALVKVWTRWPRVSAQGHAEPYVRKIILHAFLRGRRRGWTREQPSAEPPDVPTSSDEQFATDVRLDLARALRRLPPRQRAALVLRYYDDLTESQAAEALACSVGTVKSQTHKALAKLRTDVGMQDMSFLKESRHE